MKSPLGLILVAGLACLAACDGKSSATPAQTAAHLVAAAEHGGHEHAHGEGSEKRTHYAERTELFVELPVLVVGEKAAFAAHLTTLADFRALAAGKVTVRLSGNGQPDEMFSVEGASEPGIFRPEVAPLHAGERQLSIEVSTPAFREVHALGPVAVYRDDKAAHAAHDAHEEKQGGIAFSKEQQWKVDFATAEVVPRPIRAVVSATGTLRARPDGEALLSAPTAGRVLADGLFPRLGQHVKKGQLLAYLAPRLGGETDLATLRAALSKARVEHSLAEQELARMDMLYREEAVPEKRLLAARAAAALTAAELDAAGQRLGQLTGAAGGMPIRAPVDGVIADVRVTSGAYVGEGAALFHIVDRSALWLELRVPESDVARLGNPIGASFRAPGLEHGIEIVPGRNGRLIAVGGVVDAGSRSVPVLFELSAAALHLPVGMAVQAEVYVDKPAGMSRAALAVPVSSLLDEAGMAVVFAQIDAETFERRTLRLGARQGDWVEVLDGLAAGERVVSRGAYLVKLASTGTAQIGHGHAH